MAMDGPRGIVTLVRLTCGKEKFFTPGSPGCREARAVRQHGLPDVRHTDLSPVEAAIDALEAQARSMAYGKSSPDTTRDDVRDLDTR